MMNINDQRPLFRYPNTIPGIFVRRLNRFTAQVMIDDHLEKSIVAHIADDITVGVRDRKVKLIISKEF